MNSKKLFFLFSILLSMVGTKALAYDIAVKNADGVTIYYNYINDGKELEVTQGLGYENSIVIPDEVTYINKTLKVTRIGNSAFKNCMLLTSVTVGNSVKSIGENAFWDCYSLSSFTIPNSVTSIGKRAFYSCGLTSINIPNNLTTIEEGIFQHCSRLASISIPNSVTTIGESAFCGCDALTSLTIGNSVTSIGKRAFQYCSRLTSITIPKSVVSLGEEAFTIMPNLKEVISKIENPFGIWLNTFDNDVFNSATLYVPKGTIDKYKTTDGWKKFLFIEEGDGSGKTPGTQKCEKPTISYQNGKLTFHSATDGAVCYSAITDADIKSYNTNEVQLGVTYNISVYATKSGYDNSETATATLCWIDVAPKTEGITNGVANVRAMPVMIQSQGGVLNITGAPEGSVINVYDLSGKKVDSAISSSETTSIPTNLKSGEIGIVKIGDKSIKVVIQ